MREPGVASHERAVLERLPGVLICLALMAAGCGGNGSSKASPPTSHRTGAAVTTTTAALTGSVNVFAAASLTESFDALEQTLEARVPGLSITYSYAGSQALVQQIQQGAPADVFASADQKNMQRLVDAGLVETPKVFARNKLEIVVAPGNPKAVKGLADLGRADLVVVLEDPSVPAGNYSQRALQKADVTVKPKSLELDVKSALARVTAGEADAAIVYVSDVKSAGDKATGVPIPDDENVIATYPIAVVKGSSQKRAGEAFIDKVLSGAGQDVLRSHGFLPAT